LALHTCPARCGARRRCATAKLASAPCLPLRAGTLLRRSSPRQVGHAPQRLILPTTRRRLSGNHARAALPALPGGRRHPTNSGTPRQIYAGLRSQRQARSGVTGSRSTRIAGDRPAYAVIKGPPVLPRGSLQERLSASCRQAMVSCNFAPCAPQARRTRPFQANLCGCDRAFSGGAGGRRHSAPQLYVGLRFEHRSRPMSAEQPGQSRAAAVAANYAAEPSDRSTERTDRRHNLPCSRPFSINADKWQF